MQLMSVGQFIFTVFLISIILLAIFAVLVYIFRLLEKICNKAEGIKEGENRKAVEVARNLLSMEMDLLTVVQATGLSKEEIEKIKEDMN
ncbi:Na+/H+ antiporter NhaD/arsenite permease-like protein [Clostridium tetanomorphum]|uniref:Uncharacterized protein n=1 Tax=Clostridium tetanomorphum TaxID=1553 RepID=A0A923ED29_CLOTT|nr:hypothetical protein [Clostridium tetanomorphum]KAJ50150.1 hypothetical protein CTM_18869 [Clostridium tetanomorphum DSM 665]KAJ50935.1 hypothetical protein CTM_15503 [Clostridium tetanomorphum DSM 665]MBC2399756.1 hypothetical protein [Clostridium tetanomorphum]MBP1864264.1 Na+/H+ antiporter NhaD/arsenite permease-like protein [Clostridium tetanomorphum]NRS83711.1 Na+/H+ antiporter NhaD/arsenite permease-like protein [Clostridium tetanomorphum]